MVISTAHHVVVPLRRYALPSTTTLPLTANVTVGTGALTVTTAVPLTAPLVAVIVPVPAQTPVTSPELSTVMTHVLLEVQVIVGVGLIILPTWSRDVDTNWTTHHDDIVGVVGDMVIVVKTGVKHGSGALTVTTALPLTNQLVAVIVPVPAQTPVTSQELSTVMTHVLLEVQVITGAGSIILPL